MSVTTAWRTPRLKRKIHLQCLGQPKYPPSLRHLWLTSPTSAGARLERGRCAVYDTKQAVRRHNATRYPDKCPQFGRYRLLNGVRNYRCEYGSTPSRSSALGNDDEGSIWSLGTHSSYATRTGISSVNADNRYHCVQGTCPPCHPTVREGTIRRTHTIREAGVHEGDDEIQQ